MRARSLAIALIVLAACERGQRGPTCAAGAAELERFLLAMDHEPAVIWPNDLRLVTRGDLPRIDLPRAPIVGVGPDGVVYEGEPVARAWLAEALTVTRARFDDAARAGRFPERGGPDPSHIHLVVDEAATWETVVWVAEALHEAGFDAPFIVFGRPRAMQPPPRTWVDDELDRARVSEPGGLAVAGAGIMERVVKRCGALVREFGNVAAVEGDKAAYLIRAVRPALIECDCNVDMAALRSALWRLLDNPYPTTAIRVGLARDAAPIALPAATPWREAGKRFTPAARSVWLAVAK